MMKKTLNKIIAVVLISALLVGGLSIFGFATTYIGMCGDNLKWNLDTQTGLLTINGSGELYKYDSYTDIPWYNYRSSIKAVELSNGISSICPYMFYGEKMLKSVSIPKSVTAIGKYAFYGCSSLKSVSFAENCLLSEIGDYSFTYCRKLNDIQIPSKVRSIGISAFYYCYDLENLVLGVYVTQVCKKAFSCCVSLKKIEFVNDKCDIYDSDETIYSDVKIVGFKKSTAKEYADKYLRKFSQIKNIKNIRDLKIKLSYTSTDYSGYKKKPVVTIKGLKINRDFTVDYGKNKNPGLGSVTVSAAGNTIGETTLIFRIKPSRPDNIFVKERRKTSLKLSWDKVYGADGYRIYQQNGEEWTKLGDSSKNVFNVKGLSESSVYSFKIRAYTKTDEGKVFSKFSQTYATATKIPQTEITAATRAKGRIDLNWKRINNIDGYAIFISSKRNGEKKEVATVSRYSTSYRISNLKNQKVYFVSICAYKNAGGKRVLSGSSNVLKVKTI